MFEGAPFYVTLPCDSCLGVYPKNTASEWVTRLHHPIQLKGRWEVCLAEVQYSNTLWTLQEDQKMVVSQITSLNVKHKEWITKEQIITVKAGVYQEPYNDLLKSINEQMLPANEFMLELNDPANDKPGETQASTVLYQKSDKPILLFEMIENRVQAVFDNARVYVTFPEGSETLMAMLGLEARANVIRHTNLDRDIFVAWTTLSVPWQYETIWNTLVTGPWKWIAPRLFDSTAGKQILYVYCSVADYSFLGNEKAQILRTLAVSGKYAEIKTERFDSGHYVPVLGSQFEDIRVIIANETGENAHFQSGKSMVKLHFRPYRPY